MRLHRLAIALLFAVTVPARAMPSESAIRGLSTPGIAKQAKKVTGGFFGPMTGRFARLEQTVSSEDACGRLRSTTPSEQTGTVDGGRRLGAFEAVMMQERDAPAVQECLDIMPAKYPAAWHALMTAFKWHGLEVPRITPGVHNPYAPRINRHDISEALVVQDAAGGSALTTYGACAQFRTDPPGSLARSPVPLPITEPRVARCLEEMRAIYPDSWTFVQSLGDRSALRPSDLHRALTNTAPYSEFDKTHDDYLQTHSEIIEVLQSGKLAGSRLGELCEKQLRLIEQLRGSDLAKKDSGFRDELDRNERGVRAAQARLTTREEARDTGSSTSPAGIPFTPPLRFSRAGSPSQPAQDPVTKLQQALRASGVRDHPVNGQMDLATLQAVDSTMERFRNDALWGSGWTGPMDGSYSDAFAQHLKQKASELEAAVRNVNDFTSSLDRLKADGRYTEPPACGVRHNEADPSDVFGFALANGFLFEFGDDLICKWGQENAEAIAACTQRARALLLHYLTFHSGEVVIPNLIGAFFCPFGLIGIAIAVAKRSTAKEAFVIGASADLVESAIRTVGEIITFGTILAPFAAVVMAAGMAAVTGFSAMAASRRRRPAVR